MTGARRVALIGGGVRSGKSAFALSLARARGFGPRRAFIATAEALDGEMTARIEAHVRERGDGFVTVEEPIELPSAIMALATYDVVVVDCLTLWLSNLLVRGDDARAIEARIEALAHAVETARPSCILVSNEVGLGIVPESPLGRAFRDLAGRAHQRLGRSADELYMAMMGVILRLRPGPVEVVGADAGAGAGADTERR